MYGTSTNIGVCQKFSHTLNLISLRVRERGISYTLYIFSLNRRIANVIENMLMFQRYSRRWHLSNDDTFDVYFRNENTDHGCSNQI